jgi:hypothetical protein
MQPSNTKHLGTCWGTRLPTHAIDDAGRHPLHDKGFRAAREGNSWNPRPHHPPPNDWPEGLGTDPTRPLVGRPHY